MAAMATTLLEFNDKLNLREYTVPATHTVSLPRKVVQKRKTPTGTQTVAEDTILVSNAAVDSNGDVLPSRISMKVIVSRPVDAVSADIAEALATFRDIVAGDEFSSVIDTQQYLPG